MVKDAVLIQILLIGVLLAGGLLSNSITLLANVANQAVMMPNLLLAIKELN
jgi:hypothetical protein